MLSIKSLSENISQKYQIDKNLKNFYLSQRVNGWSESRFIFRGFCCKTAFFLQNAPELRENSPGRAV